MLPLPDISAGTRVVVGMSGGIDSATTALLLQAAGAKVLAVTLRMRTCSETAQNGPASDNDACTAAAAVAAQLGIPHRVVDARDRFDHDILHPCWEALASGRTPNPCVLCNAYIKLPMLAEVADDLGGGLIATGHYLRTRVAADGTSRLRRGVDLSKDQSYFLYAVAPALVQRLVLPLGGLHKQQVRNHAIACGLTNAKRAESQDLCFAGDGSGPFAESLRHFLGATARPGRLRHRDGRILGEHSGVHQFTVGQRRGIGAFGPRPHCITAIDAASAEITLSDTPDDLLADTCQATSCIWQGPPPAPGTVCLAQVRYRQRAVPVTICASDDSTCTVHFASPVRAITPGQALVLYDDDTVRGGGIIEKAWRTPLAQP